MTGNEPGNKLGLLSRTIAYALRHHPEAFDLEIDRDGWTSITDFIFALKLHQPQWDGVSKRDFEQVISSNSKKRFEIQGDRIRALYGHSIGQKIQLQSALPPELLFHGTTPEALDKIRKGGLKPMRRQYVHLSPDKQTARLVAVRRTDSPAIITVLSRQAADRGSCFYPRIDAVWLADKIAAEFLIFP